MPSSAFRSCWWKTFRSPRKGGERGEEKRKRKKKERGKRGKKGGKVPTSYVQHYDTLIFSSFFSVLILSFNIEGSAVVQRLLVIQLLKRLSFTFTFATQNARKVQGNRQYRRKVISIDDEWGFRTLARHVREDVKRFGDWCFDMAEFYHGLVRQQKEVKKTVCWNDR